jgi:hypothetical protein
MIWDPLHRHADPQHKHQRGQITATEREEEASALICPLRAQHENTENLYRQTPVLPRIITHHKPPGPRLSASRAAILRSIRSKRVHAYASTEHAVDFAILNRQQR